MGAIQSVVSAALYLTRLASAPTVRLFCPDFGGGWFKLGVTSGATCKSFIQTFHRKFWIVFSLVCYPLEQFTG